MAKENVTIRNFDKELWFKFVAKVKTEKKKYPRGSRETYKWASW